MTSSGTKAEVKASVDVRPAGSQVYLVAGAIVSAISLICGATLIGVGNAGGWVFVLFALIILGAGLWGWRTSQSDTDLGKAHPTQLTLTDGTKLTTDSRMLRSPEAAQALIQVCAEMLSRKPLPNPDGLVDAKGQAIPDSKDEAVVRATQINETTQVATLSILEVMNHATDGSFVTQGRVDSADHGPDSSALSPQSLTK